MFTHTLFFSEVEKKESNSSLTASKKNHKMQPVNRDFRGESPMNQECEHLWLLWTIMPGSNSYMELFNCFLQNLKHILNLIFNTLK